MQTDIYPDFKKDVLLVRFLSFGLVSIGLIVFAVTVMLVWQGIVHQTLGRIGTAVFLTTAGGLFFALLFSSRYFLRTRLANLRQASLILGTGAAIKQKMVFSGEVMLGGAYAELLPPSEITTENHGEAVCLTLPKWKILPVGASLVDVFRTTGGEQRFLAIRTDSQWLFGRTLTEIEEFRFYKKRKRLIIAILALGVLLLLAMFSYQFWRTANFYRTYVQAGQSLQWPSVAGKMGYAFVREAETAPKDKGKALYEVVLTYEYAVEGHIYKGDRVSFGDRALSERAAAEAIVDRYKRSPSIRVFYNPSAPAVSVLEPGLRKDLQGQLWGMGILMTFTVLVILTAVLMCASGLKKMGTTPPSS